MIFDCTKICKPVLSKYFCFRNCCIAAAVVVAFVVVVVVVVVLLSLFLRIPVVAAVSLNIKAANA